MSTFAKPGRESLAGLIKRRDAIEDALRQAVADASTVEPKKPAPTAPPDMAATIRSKLRELNRKQ